MTSSSSAPATLPWLPRFLPRKTAPNASSWSKKPRAKMRGGNTHWSGGVLRFAFDDPREIGELLPDVEEQFENFYDGVSPYTQDDFHGDLMRVTSGRTDPVLSKLLVSSSFDTVKWMKKVGGIKMEPAITLSAVKKGNVMVWARGLVVRAEHEGVGLSRSWFSTAERLGIEIRYGAAATELLIGDDGRKSAASRCAMTTAFRSSMPDRWCSAAAVSKPMCRCAPSTSARWLVLQKCAARRTTRATVCGWR